MKTITPLILGRGRAGDAISKGFLDLSLMVPELQIARPIGLERGVDLAIERKKHEHPLLCIANPHGLHAQAILSGAAAGFEAILCEKPACVNLEEIKKLSQVKVPTAVLHVYRQTWGVQTLKQMIDSGELGELITIEGRYWQSSTAERALQGEGPSHSWKNDPKLSGQYDVFLDIATHWVDSASFLFGALPEQIEGWKSLKNAETSHRDSHVQLNLRYPKGHRGFVSVSKTVHGSTNHFELNVLGTKRSATWKFLEPDEIFIGEGRDRKVITRKSTEFGSRQPAFHAQGWLEGYIEIAHGLLSEAFLGKPKNYPALKGNLKLLEVMLNTSWN